MVPEKLKEILSSKDKKTVLLIEDHILFARTLSMALLQIAPNMEIIVPSSYEEVEDILRDQPSRFDLVLLDYSLGYWLDAAGRSGYTLAPLVRKTNPEAFVLCHSNDQSSAEILEEKKLVDFSYGKNLLLDFFKEVISNERSHV